MAICDEQFKIRLMGAATIHRCKKDRDHTGGHACLAVTATGRKCDFTWKRGIPEKDRK